MPEILSVHNPAEASPASAEASAPLAEWAPPCLLGRRRWRLDRP